MTVRFAEPVTLNGVLLGIGRTGPYNVVISVETDGQWHEVVNESAFTADSVRPNILLLDEVQRVVAIRFATTDKWLFLSELLGVSYETVPAVGFALSHARPSVVRGVRAHEARVYDLTGRVVRSGRHAARIPSLHSSAGLLADPRRAAGVFVRPDAHNEAP